VALSRDEVYERVKVALVDKLGADEGAITEDASFRTTSTPTRSISSS
jgi:hypothetical protein